MASLLEVGTGFHPELTGRENIFLNGAILGMHRREIKAKFDEIVAFAEVERFLDTPVKRYSSGMYVRLAFAVAAHLEPEILIVDEVLAVGDAEFQKKCLGKMQERGRGQGRTVLFVSHNMGAVQSLCTTAMALSKGRLVNRGPVRDIVKQYLQGSGTEDEASVWVNSTRQHDGPYFMPRRFAVVDAGTGESVAQIARTDELMVQIEGEIKTLDTALTIGYALFDEAGTMLYWSYQTDLAQDEWPKLPLGPLPSPEPLAHRMAQRGHLPAGVDRQPILPGVDFPAEGERAIDLGHGWRQDERFTPLHERAARGAGPVVPLAERGLIPHSSL